jgi:hypothetical protein
MERPHVYRNGGVTLTYDAQVGFVLEDAENPHNFSIYAGGPFWTLHPTDKDRGTLLNMIGVCKTLLHEVNAANTRDVAVLVYYADRPTFHYQARFEGHEMTALDATGRFVVTEAPRFFKMRVDSDLSTPYGDPMQGNLIYLKQSPGTDIIVSTLGLLDT